MQHEFWEKWLPIIVLARGVWIQFADETLGVRPGTGVVPLVGLAVDLHAVLVPEVVGLAGLPVGVVNRAIVVEPGPSALVGDVGQSDPVVFAAFVTPVVNEEIVDPVALQLIAQRGQVGVFRPAEDLSLGPPLLLGPEFVAVAPQSPIVACRAAGA